MEQLIPGLPNDIVRDCFFRLPYNYLSDASSVCKDWGKEIQQPEFLRLRKATGHSQPVIAMAQVRVNPKPKCSTAPEYKISTFEPKTGSWSELPLFPATALSKGLPILCQLAGVGSDLIVMGGLDPHTWGVSNSVYIYNYISSTWRRGADMPGVRRWFFGCASDPTNRMVFVVGGHDHEKNALRSSMAYDVANNKWIQLADMARERDECKAIFHRGKLHAIGGYRTEEQGEFVTSAEIFDPVTSKWDQVIEDFLPANVSPKSCVAGGHGGKFYMSRASHLALREGPTWHAVAEIPADVSNTDVGSATAWQDELLVTRSGEHSVAYVLDLCSYLWRKVELPENYRGHVHSSCCLEI